MTPEEAKTYVLPIFNTPNLEQLLDSLCKDDPLSDARPAIVDYIKAEHPELASRFMTLGMLRDENIEGSLSPLGHKDEEE